MKIQPLSDISTLYGSWYPSAENSAVRKDGSILVSSTIKISTLLINIHGRESNLDVTEFILR